MISYRIRGLINIHAVLTALGGMLLLFAYAELFPFLFDVRLGEDVNLFPYCLAAAVGMIASHPQLREYAYQLDRLRLSNALKLSIRQTLYVSACIFGLMFATKDRDVSRLFLGSYLIFLIVLLAWAHCTGPKILARLLFPEHRLLPTLFVGSSASLERLDSWLKSREHLGVVPVGILADEPTTRADRLMAPYLGKVELLPKLVREHRIGQVILLDVSEKAERVDWIVDICQSEGCRFLLYNNFGDRFGQAFVPLEEGGHQFLALQDEPLEDPINRGLKRFLDIVISLPVVLFALPLLCAVVWFFQRLQAPGPVFFVRPRGGHNRRDFAMFKFRSMYMSDPSGEARQARSDDERIYPIGRILRKTSLDEFPQFINVLKGDMSIVGPRPHLPQHDEEFSRITRTYRSRSLVKPGITGMAQVNGYRGEITDPEKLHRRIYWDLYYINRWSLVMDIHIICRTAWQVFFPPETAY